MSANMYDNYSSDSDVPVDIIPEEQSSAESVENEESDEPLIEESDEPDQESTIEPVVFHVDEPDQESTIEPVVFHVDEPDQESTVEQVIADVEEKEDSILEVIQEEEEELVFTDVEEEKEPVSNELDHAIANETVNITMNIAEIEIMFPVEKAPKLIFIVPYRDRLQQLSFFKTHMISILEDIPQDDYKIYFIHQQDERDFNRGGIKNIGFIAMKEKYPNDYKNITFIFNDVDTMPFTKNFLNYETTTGTVKHFYGFTYALGGIVSITGADFERVNGYPNLWTWGFEDNLLQKRVLAAGITIDRSQFYPIMDKNIFQMKDGLLRIVNRGEFDRYTNDTNEGICTIESRSFAIDEAEGFVNVSGFDTGVSPNTQTNSVYDVRTGNRIFAHALQTQSRRPRPRMGMML